MMIPNDIQQNLTRLLIRLDCETRFKELLSLSPVALDVLVEPFVKDFPELALAVF
jgi:hypothetical protein